MRPLIFIRFSNGSSVAETFFMPELKFVYVLRSVAQPGRHYVGLACDVAARVAAHNAGRSRYTARHTPWRLLVSLEFADQGTAARSWSACARAPARRR
jgi:putative endonuclease